TGEEHQQANELLSNACFLGNVHCTTSATSATSERHSVCSARFALNQLLLLSTDEPEEVLPQLNHPLSEFEEGELSQNYLPSQERDYSYSPVKQVKERGPQKASQLASYGGQSYDGPSYDGHSYEGHPDQFGFAEDHNTVDWLKNSIRGEPGKDYPVYA